jgi:hypothetical protein
MPVLVISMPGKGPMRYEMTEDTVTIGRAKGSTVRLAGDAAISQTHCRIRAAGRRFVLEDAGSANGTRLNGRPIGGSTRELFSGDRVRIGSTEIVFDDPRSPKRGWLSRLKDGVFGAGHGAGAGGGRAGPGGTVFGDGFVKCGKCGAKIHTGGKGPGQKVGCSRCRSVYVIPSR